MSAPMETPYKRTWRLGPRERQRLQIALVLVVILLLWFIAFQPYLRGVIQTRDYQSCQVNCQKIGQAVSRYMQDWDETYPPGPTWMTNASGMLTSTSGSGFSVSHYFHCPLDHTGSASSYVYNDLIAGINPAIEQPRGSAMAERRGLVRAPSRFPMILEKHGTAQNGSVTVRNWDQVLAEMMFPHAAPSPAGSYVDGGGNSRRLTQEQARNQAGKRF